MNKALVCGAGGFIGSHMVKRLEKEGWLIPILQDRSISVLRKWRPFQGLK